MKKYLVHKLFLSIILIVVSGFTYADTQDKEVIKRTASEYFSLLENKDYQNSFEYIYPQLFQFVPKDLMIQAMLDMEKDKSILMSFEDFKVSNVSDLISIGSVFYANVQYSFILNMKVKSKNNDEDNKTVDFTLAALQSKFGEDNVVFDKKNSTYRITSKNQMFAIKDPAYSGWKFLENKEALREILDKMIPEQVWDEFKLVKESTK